MVDKTSNAVSRGADSPGAVDYFDSTALREKALDQDRFVPLIIEAGTKSEYLFWGFGSPSRQDGNTGYFYASIDVTNDGGSTTSVLAGKLRFEVYNDLNHEDPKAFSHNYNSQDLHEALNESRTDRPILPMQSPGAADDETIVMSAKVQSTQDGYNVYADTSNIHIPYTKVSP